MNFKKLINLIICLFYLLAVIPALAQSLPNKQAVGMRTPSNIKIDGKSTEWNNQYQAFNNGTEIFYSITNTDTTLNLVVHAVNPPVIQKILENGIGFTILKNKSDKKNADVKLVFPSISFADAWKILKGVGLPIAGFREIRGVPPGMVVGLEPILETQKEYSLAGANKQLTSILKEIRYLGIEAIKDTLTGITPETPHYRNFSLRTEGYKHITIYNEDDIRAAVQFDAKKELTYELSIPLKYFKDNIINGTLKYDITIHARDGRRPGVQVFYDRRDGQSSIAFPELFNATNVEGEYTLAK
jgi:hypothetical protein